MSSGYARTTQPGGPDVGRWAVSPSFGGARCWPAYRMAWTPRWAGVCLREVAFVTD